MESIKKRDMKMIQRKHLLFSVMLVLSGGAIFADEIKDIDETYDNVFGDKMNLFNEKNKDTYRWTPFLFNLRNYVNKNAGGNKKLEEAFKECQATSQQLIYVLQTIYDDIFEAEDLDTMKIQSARSGIRSLKWARDNNLEEEEKKLINTRYLWPGRKEAKKVLLHLIDKLKDAIDKLSNDFEDKIISMGTGLF